MRRVSEVKATQDATFSHLLKMPKRRREENETNLVVLDWEENESVSRFLEKRFVLVRLDVEVTNETKSTFTLKVIDYISTLVYFANGSNGSDRVGFDGGGKSRLLQHGTRSFGWSRERVLILV